MNLFRKQPIFCPACGVQYEGDPTRPLCSMECIKELEWRRALFTLGKEYYPQGVPTTESEPS